MSLWPVNFAFFLSTIISTSFSPSFVNLLQVWDHQGVTSPKPEQGNSTWHSVFLTAGYQQEINLFLEGFCWRATNGSAEVLRVAQHSWDLGWWHEGESPPFCSHTEPLALAFGVEVECFVFEVLFYHRAIELLWVSDWIARVLRCAATLSEIHLSLHGQETDNSQCFSALLNCYFLW